MKITSQIFIKKAVDQFNAYKLDQEKQEKFILIQSFLEDLSVELKNRNIDELNGQNFTLKIK